MIYFFSFCYSFIFNDGRLLYKVFGGNLQFIKYRLVLRELGPIVYLGFLLLNLSKGLFPLLFVNDYYLQMITAILVLVGNYLGAKPGVTGGNELMILWGIWLGIDLQMVQTPLAIMLGVWVITFKLELGLVLSSLIILFKLLYLKYFFLLILSVMVLVNYGWKEYAQFSLLENRLKEKFNSVTDKGVKIL